MTFANVGTLETLPGRRDEVIAILIRPNAELQASGCLLYEVGVNESEPDTIFVCEIWESSEAHRASLQLASVRAAIQAAMPHLTGTMGGNTFSVVGSPLRHDA